MKPGASARNLTPSSISLGSDSPGAAKELSQIEQGQVRATISTLFWSPGFSRLVLSSVARAITDAAPALPGVHLYFHDSRPSAGCQLAPPSVATSTAATCPLASLEVPVTVIGVPLSS